MGVTPPGGSTATPPFSILLLKTNFLTHISIPFKFAPIDFFCKQKILQQKFLALNCAFAHTVKKWSEKWKFWKIFLTLFITILLTITTQNFVKIGEKIILDIFGPFLDHCAAKKIFSPILTKFCVVIVKSMVIKNIKKNFQNFYFLDHFLTVCANAHCDGKNFCCKIFHLQ